MNEDEAIDAIIARILNVEPRVGAWKLASSTSPSSPLQAMNIITSGLKQGITLMDNPSDLRCELHPKLNWQSAVPRNLRSKEFSGHRIANCNSEAPKTSPNTCVSLRDKV